MEKIIQTQKLKNVQRYAKISDTPVDQRSLIHQEAWFPPCFVRQNQREKKRKKIARRFLTIIKQKCSNLRPLLSITFPQGFRSSKNIRHPTSGSGGKKTVKRYLKVKKSERKKNFFLRGDFRQFSNKNVHIQDHFFPLLFPKDSESLKILDIRLWEVGAKRPLNGTSKVKKVREKHFFFARRFQTIFKQKCSYLRPLLSITIPQGFRISKNIGHPTSGSGGKKTVKRYLKSEQPHRRTDRRTDIQTYRKHRPRGPML